MLFACSRSWPNDALPNALLAGAAHCTMLRGLSSSTRTDNDERPGRFTFFAADMLNDVRNGDRTPGSVRGALPNWFRPTAWNADRLKYWLSVGLAEMRPVMSPSARSGCPSTRFGLSVPPIRNNVPFTFWLTPTGNPLWNCATPVTDQPPSRASASPLFDR